MEQMPVFAPPRVLTSNGSGKSPVTGTDVQTLIGPTGNDQEKSTPPCYGFSRPCRCIDRPHHHILPCRPPLLWDRLNRPSRLRPAGMTARRAAAASRRRRGRGGVGRAEDDDDEKDDDDDCPACVEYTAGPCGEQFQAWLDCTNRHENDYEIQCKTQFHNFHNCLQWKLHHTTLMEDYLEEEDEEGI
jgi:hypothetical protein